MMPVALPGDKPSLALPANSWRENAGFIDRQGCRTAVGIAALQYNEFPHPEGTFISALSLLEAGAFS